MTSVVFIGDEALAAAFRLAGVDARCPAPSELASVFDRACADAALLIISRRVADALPRERLDRQRAQLEPLLVVLPEPGDAGADDELERRMHAVLGIEA